MIQVLCQFRKNITTVRAQENIITYSLEEDRVTLRLQCVLDHVPKRRSDEAALGRKARIKLT